MNMFPGIENSIYLCNYLPWSKKFGLSFWMLAHLKAVGKKKKIEYCFSFKIIHNICAQISECIRVYRLARERCLNTFGNLGLMFTLFWGALRWRSDCCKVINIELLDSPECLYGVWYFLYQWLGSNSSKNTAVIYMKRKNYLDNFAFIQYLFLISPSLDL